MEKAESAEILSCTPGISIHFVPEVASELFDMGMTSDVETMTYPPWLRRWVSQRQPLWQTD